MSEIRACCYASLLLALTVACGASEAPGEPTTSRLDSPEWTKETPVYSAPEEPASASRDERCTGSKLSVDELARLGICDSAAPAQRLPAAVTAGVADEQVLAIQGQEATVRLELVNEGTVPVDLFLDHSCGLYNSVQPTFFSRSGVRLDQVGRRDCNTPRTCAGHTVHLTLPPQGTAEVPFTVRAQVTVVGDDCDELPGRPLAAGHYDVMVRAFYNEEPVRFKMKVSALERLSVGECERYSATVARLAEPDPKLVDRVAARLQEDCRRKPPSRAFADCRMNAKTETALAACREVALP